MPDALDIIDQNARATASFFQSVNSSINQIAKNEIGMARAAGSIIESTIRAREAQRVNDSNIRSNLIRDQLAVNLDARQQAEFELQAELAPLEILNTKLEMEVRRSQVINERAKSLENNARNFLISRNESLATEAFGQLYSTGDPSLLNAFDDASSRAIQGVVSGRMGIDEANQFLESKFNQAKKGFTPSRVEYNPATTRLIERTIGPEAAQAYDLEYNPNKSAIKNSTRASIVAQGSPQAKLEMLQSIGDPKEKSRIEKAMSEFESAELSAKTYSDIRKKFTDDFGNPQIGSPDSLTIVGSDGKPDRFNKKAFEDKVNFIKGIESRINQSINRQQQIIQAIQSGADIPDPIQEVTNELVGSTGQTAQPSLLQSPSEDQIEQAKLSQGAHGPIKRDFIEELRKPEALNGLDLVKAVSNNVSEDQDLEEVLSVFANAENIPKRSVAIEEIKSSLNSLNESELLSIIKKEGGVIDLISDNPRNLELIKEGRGKLIMKSLSESKSVPNNVSKDEVVSAIAEGITNLVYGEVKSRLKNRKKRK